MDTDKHNGLSGMMKDISNLKNRLSISNSGDKYMATLQNENEKLKKENEFLVERLNTQGCRNNKQARGSVLPLLRNVISFSPFQISLFLAKFPFTTIMIFT